MLSYTRHPDLDFTYLISDGKTSIDEWLDIVNTYRSEGLTNRELYDLRRHENLFSNEEISKILQVAVKNRALNTTNRKTAIVVDNPSKFGLSRMYELQSEVEGVLTKSHVFYHMDKAVEWLGDDIAGCIPDSGSDTNEA